MIENSAARVQGNLSGDLRDLHLTPDAPALIQRLSPLSPERIPGFIVDVTSRRLRLRCSVFVQRGTIVQVRIGTLYILGEVRYCAALADASQGFWLAIRIEDCCGTDLAVA